MKSLSFQDNTSQCEDSIVLVHGGGIGGRLWSRTLQSLPEYHCLAPDLPGFGGSRHISPFSVETTVEGVADLIREHTLSGRASVVGFSVGAVVCVELLNRYPDLVERVFLSGATPRLGKGAVTISNAMARLMLPMFGPEGLSRITARTMRLTPQQVEEFQDDMKSLSSNLFTQINEVVAEQTDPIPTATATMVFAGEEELGAVKKRARELVEGLGNARGYIVQGRGHVWCLEDPDLFHRTIRAWMSGEPLGEGFGPL